MKKKCFVIIGFGKKSSYANGKVRVLDLDETFETLIKPVFESLDIECYRAIDKNVNGSIDRLMLQEIKNADFVLADISTLNANVLWELGVRHALKPCHTIMICEKEQMASIPFDINHFIVHKYVHTEDGIPNKEVPRFKAHLKDIIEKLLAMTEEQIDSPVFEFLKDNITPPQIIKQDNIRGANIENLIDGIFPGNNKSNNDNTFNIKNITAAHHHDGNSNTENNFQQYAPPQNIGAKSDSGLLITNSEPAKPMSFVEIINKAEAAKKQGHYTEALVHLAKAKEMASDNMTLRDNLSFVITRQALCTYKAASGNEKIKALKDAIGILSALNPADSTDTEVLGLSGSINKQLYEITGEEQYLDNAIKYYEKGFMLKQDYYNGVNAVFMLYIKAFTTKVDEEQQDNIITQAKYICNNILAICLKLENEKDFLKGSDAIWVLQTLAEIYHYRKNDDKMNEYEQKAENVATHTNNPDATASYIKQKTKIKEILSTKA